MCASRKNGSDVIGESTVYAWWHPRADGEMLSSLLVDTQTIEVVNRWRRERRDQELRVADFAKSTEHAP